ncbi:MAG TPA: hypothetical protein VGA22_01720 [Gemmatimonadales bacterium]|jgi:hypothetical protein
MRAPRGRFWIGVWLVFGLSVLLLVVARQTSGFVAVRHLDELRGERAALEAERAAFQQQVREAESRRVLVPRAESLGLRAPADSEIRILRVPGAH